MTALPFHPLANLFPLLDGEEFDAFVADIKAHGLRQRIVLCNGAILDGRNRYRACLKAGVEPHAVPFRAKMSPIDFVISANDKRRHMTSSQRAMSAAKLANMRQGTRTDLSSNELKSLISQGDAAQKLHVSKASVKRAATVLPPLLAAGRKPHAREAPPDIREVAE